MYQRYNRWTRHERHIQTIILNAHIWYGWMFVDRCFVAISLHRTYPIIIVLTALFYEKKICFAEFYFKAATLQTIQHSTVHTKHVVLDKRHTTMLTHSEFVCFAVLAIIVIINKLIEYLIQMKMCSVTMLTYNTHAAQRARANI